MPCGVGVEVRTCEADLSSHATDNAVIELKREGHMINRLLGIIYILMNKGNVTAAELAERFEVSVRTIYRDVETLSMAGIPVYSQKGKNGGIGLTEQFVLNKLLISKEEQQRILAALTSLGEMGGKEEAVILQKLGDFFKTDTPAWVSIDFSDWSGRRQELFEQIREAILGRHVMEFDYYGQYGEMTHRVAEPIQLLFKDYTWYVRAFCRNKQAMRLFKVLRMKRVQVLDEVYEAHESPQFGQGLLGGESNQKGVLGDTDMMPGSANGFSKGDNKETVEGTGMTSDVEDKKSVEERQVPQIRLHILNKEAYRIYDKFEEEEITVLENGDFEVCFQYYLDDWVYGLILSFGPSAKVLEPAFVREELEERIRRMAELYRADSI